MQRQSTGKVRISRGQRIWAAILVVTGMAALVTQRWPSAVFTGCGCFLNAWAMMYYPAPGFRSTLGEVYQSQKRGAWIAPKYVRLVMLLSVILMILGSIDPFKR